MFIELIKELDYISITPSELVSYLFCPRFVYFQNYLDISEHEEKRFKVMKGRNIHKEKTIINKDYLRKKLNVIDKKIDKKMYSKKNHIHGIVDEILFFEDGSAGPLDYKFSKYKKVYNTQKYQMTMYALMIEDNYNIEVNRAYLVYTRSKNFVKEIKITDRMKNDVKNMVNEYIKIINIGSYPKKTNYSKKCFDCAYKNICIK
jgi:CRISPR-associated exonuclease Cas4